MKFEQWVVDRVIARAGRLHGDDPIDAARTAFVIIDMQNYFTQPGFQAENPVARDTFGAINRLAARLRDAGGQVIWIQTSSQDALAHWSHWHEKLLTPERRVRRLAELHPDHPGHAIADGLEVHPADLCLSKCVYSALTPLPDGTPSDLARALQERGIDTILIGGTATNVCCESTARDAMMMNYETIMVDDTLSASTKAEHANALNNWIIHFGDVLSADDVSARLR